MSKVQDPFSTVIGEMLIVCDTDDCGEHSETCTMYRCECPADRCGEHSEKCVSCRLRFCSECGLDDLDDDGACPSCVEEEAGERLYGHPSLTDQERNPGLR